MAARALIIAIENYPAAQGGWMERHLPGTLDAGLQFKAWLEEKWKNESRSDGQLLFCSEPIQPDGRGATRADIITALDKLKTDGQNATEELYFFFSGHGFSFAEGINSPRADTIVSSDFAAPATSGPCCLKLDEIIYWLRGNLGPGRHYYFIDACRNQLDPRQIRVSAQLPMDPQSSAEASTFVLKSTVDGAVAAVGGPFPKLLLAGLRGSGRAKVWDASVRDAMLVRYDSLRSYLKSSIRNQPITSTVDGPDGDNEAVLATIRPIPQSTCTIRISNGSNRLSGEVIYTRGRSSAEHRQALKGATAVLALEPDDYAFAVRLKEGQVDPPGLVPADLYDDKTLEFRRLGAREEAPEPPAAEAMVAVTVAVPPRSTIDLVNLNSGEIRSLSATSRIKVPEGRYLATIQDAQRQVFRRQELDLAVGAEKLDLTDWRSSIPHVSIASRLPTSGNAVDFSESLGGEVTDPGLDLWLALLGGGRILGKTKTEFSKLSQFPLRDFSTERRGASPIYVLAGLEARDQALRVGLSTDDVPNWSTGRQPDGMLGIREWYYPLGVGPCLVSFQIPDNPPYTVASFALPNRATLITFTVGPDNNLRIAQYLLPIGHLIRYLPLGVRNNLQQRVPLDDVRLIANAHRAFRRRRNLATAIPSSELEKLLDAKWIDPIGSCLAAYEFLRRGKAAEMRTVVRNMSKFFPELPDASALARLAGRDKRAVNNVPLFLDGLRAFPKYADMLPLPAGHLDFNSPWTAWRAAVATD